MLYCSQLSEKTNIRILIVVHNEHQYKSLIQMKQKLNIGRYLMESLWNSPDKVDLIRIVAQWIVAISGIIALIFTMRSTTLKNHADLAKATAELANRTLLESKIQSANAELIHTKSELEKIRPKPLTERMRRLLITIDPKIIPALKAGNTNFNGGITSSQFNELQKIAKEPDANKYITISPDVNTGIGMGPEGITYGVKFTLNPQLIKD